MDAKSKIASQASIIQDLERRAASTQRAQISDMDAQHKQLLNQGRQEWPSPSPEPINAIFGKPGVGV